MLVKLYRYRVPKTGGFVISIGEPEGLVQRVSLHDRRDFDRHVDLHWYRDEDAARRPDAPGALLPEGSVVESEEEFEDLHATLLALSHPGLATRSLARDALARALAERLAEAVPTGFLTPALAAWLDRTFAWLFDQGGEGAEVLEEAARVALDVLQDEIAESTGNPFPLLREPGAPPLPEASARFDGETLTAWYGDEENPAWALVPIAASELHVATLPGMRIAPARGFEELTPPVVEDAPPELDGVTTYGELVTLVLTDVMAPYDELEEFVDPAYDSPRIAHLLGLEVELANALLYALRGLRTGSRTSVVREFFSRRSPRATQISDRSDGQRTFADPMVDRRLAAQAALEVLDFAEDPELSTPQVRDLLQGAAQGDPVVETPQAWSAAVRAAEIARRRRRYDEGESAAAAATAVREALDPRHGRMSLHDVVLSAARAIAVADDTGRLVEFLLAMDRSFADAQSSD